MKEPLKRFEEIRHELKMSQKAFCEKLEIHPSNYSGMKNGSKPIFVKMYLKAQQVFNINAVWLRDGTGEKYVESWLKLDPPNLPPKKHDQMLKPQIEEIIERVENDLKIIEELYHISLKIKGYQNYEIQKAIRKGEAELVAYHQSQVELVGLLEAEEKRKLETLNSN